jgi:uncharacterized protein YndB with AHSA1/START domain
MLPVSAIPGVRHKAPEVREMTGTRTRVEESIHVDAPPGAVFGYCLDPRQLFAGDPKHAVEAEVAPGGVGTTARLSKTLGLLEEHDRLEYVEVVPDRRIEIAMQPTITPRGLAKPQHDTALYSLIHEFVPEGDGTRMTLEVQVHDARLFERTVDRLEGKRAEKMVHNRLQRIATAVKDAAAGG